MNLSDLCAECGHAAQDHAELIQSKYDSPERRQCLHGEYDPRAGKRACPCETFKQQPGEER